MHSTLPVERRRSQPPVSEKHAAQRVLVLRRRFLRRTPPASRFSLDAEIFTAAAVLGAALVLGLATTADYGISIDEFNADDYGPKALAWLSFCFCRRQRSRSN